MTSGHERGTDPASGGALVAPDYQPRIISGSIQAIVVADLFAPGTTGSNVVPTMVEKSFTNAAAPVLEGGVKPESTLIFEAQPEPVRKIAHWIPVSEELLEDAVAVGSYIDGRIRYGVLRKEDQQLLTGTGVAPELLGVVIRPGLAPDVARVDARECGFDPHPRHKFASRACYENSPHTTIVWPTTDRSPIVNDRSPIGNGRSAIDNGSIANLQSRSRQSAVVSRQCRVPAFRREVTSVLTYRIASMTSSVTITASAHSPTPVVA